MKKLLLITIVLISATFAKAQWQQTNEIYSANIYCFAVSGANIVSSVFCLKSSCTNWYDVSCSLINNNVI